MDLRLLSKGMILLHIKVKKSSWLRLTSYQNFDEKNIIELIGFCVQGKECILVYEYIPNGSLASTISGKFSILTKTNASIFFL